MHCKEALQNEEQRNCRKGTLLKLSSILYETRTNDQYTKERAIGREMLSNAFGILPVSLL